MKPVYYISCSGINEEARIGQRLIRASSFRAAPRNSARSLRQGFAPIQSLENEGILYVFLVFQTEEVGQKDGGDSQSQLCGVALNTFQV